MNKKSVLITGCSSGIGYDTAFYLKEKGWEVLVSARKKEDVELLRKKGFWGCELDLDSSKSIDQAFEQVTQKTKGKLFALFNNAGDGHPGYIEDVTRESLEEQFQTNVFGTHELTVKALKLMKKNGEGRIINNSSVLGFVSVAGRGAYCASKFALEALSTSLRVEIQKSNQSIYISVIQPGPIVSQFRENAVKNLRKYVKVNESFYKKQYERKLNNKDLIKGTLKGEDVACKVYHALTARVPKRYYRVTIHTHIAFYLDKILPRVWLDKIVSRF